MNFGFDTRKEKLLTLMLLDDRVAPQITDKAGVAFWRGFIVEDRETHRVTARFRFRYADGDSWHELKPKEDAGSVQEIVDEIESAWRLMLKTAMPVITGFKIHDKHVIAFHPPDDEGHPGRTLDWLLAKDLVQITKVTRIERKTG